jgi:hypothetical protein
MDDPTLVRMGKGLAKMVCNAEGPSQWEAVMRRSLQEILNGAAFHVLAHEVWLTVLLTDVIDGNDVGMGT